jgi:regulator of sigma E protease
MLLTLVAFLIVIGVIVIIHETGHFVAAKLTGMRVNKFSIGFPPRLYSRKIGETEFSISWIPLGGYVQIAGMIDESLEGNTITGAPWEFMSKSALQKIFVLSAGVLMNYVIAFVLAAALTLSYGTAQVAGTAIGEVMSGMPAEKAGIEPGDEIVAVGGDKTSTWEQVVDRISGSEDTVALTIKKAATGQNVDVAIPTQLTQEGGESRRIIGVTPKLEFEPAGLFTAIGRGASFCYGTTRGIVVFLGQLVTGRSSISELAGPLGVAQLSGESARQGTGSFLFFLAYVSVSIGFLNILPFPVLDGGHIVFVVIESIIRRPVPTNIKLWVQQIGVGLLLLLVLFVSYHEVLRIFSH